MRETVAMLKDSVTSVKKSFTEQSVSLRELENRQTEQYFTTSRQLTDIVREHWKLDTIVRKPSDVNSVIFNKTKEV
jgi:phosphate uptake regulator